ncbi:hypothetical protein TNCT_448361 [Trichonephila clavata]|uniref:Uncharacterized protein n=1 Tax=Trichonephila clavata TaxID=2740835 RepID=A0A8X6F5E5_TRICU|nr:hypothetical protein TNCT_448361 [Trichonephila clavata]
MHPLYRLGSHYLIIIHRWVYRNFVENCILNVPVGTELHVNGRKDHFLTNRFVRTEEGDFYMISWYMRTSAIGFVCLRVQSNGMDPDTRDYGDFNFGWI